MVRKLAVVATCRRFDMESICAEFAPGYPVEMISGARLRTGVNGSAAAILDVPADLVSDVTADLRRGLRGVTPVRPILFGCAVTDDTPGYDDNELLQAAGLALVSGHGVAHDLEVQHRRQEHASATRGLRGRLGTLYAAATPRGKRVILIALTAVGGLLLPFLTYSALWQVRIDIAPVAFWVVFAMLVLTAGSIAAEMLHAIAPPDLPAVEDERVRASDPVRTGIWPRISVVIAAYLPNEVEVLPESVKTLLTLDYAGDYEILVAANGDGPRAVEALGIIRKLVAGDDRLRLVLAPGSRSKAENINAALEVASGDIVGVLDADHQLASDVLSRAARWIAGGYADVVQGHNVVRNGEESRLARTVAVEFEGIYAVAHPGRARLHGFGIFGGSNGFWRADLLDRLRMRPWMLTEDIDVSTRALLAGAVICSDRWMVSRELAPTTLTGFWSQRMRWSQGWHQVSRRYLKPSLKAKNLSIRQKLGFTTMFWLREVYPWVALQMFPLLSYQLLVRHTRHVHWLLPPFVLATICVTSMGPLQAFAAWRFAAPEMRTRHRWFAEYLFKTGALFGELKAVINRGAHLRQWLGDEAWAVTPRNADHALDAAAGPADPSLALPGTGIEQAEVIRDSDGDLPGVPAVALPLVFLADGRGRARAVSLTRMMRGPLEAGAAPFASSAELITRVSA